MDPIWACTNCLQAFERRDHQDLRGDEVEVVRQASRVEAHVNRYQIVKQSSQVKVSNAMHQSRTPDTVAISPCSRPVLKLYASTLAKGHSPASTYSLYLTTASIAA